MCLETSLEIIKSSKNWNSQKIRNLLYHQWTMSFINLLHHSSLMAQQKVWNWKTCEQVCHWTRHFPPIFFLWLSQPRSSNLTLVTSLWTARQLQWDKKKKKEIRQSFGATGTPTADSFSAIPAEGNQPGTNSRISEAKTFRMQTHREPHSASDWLSHSLRCSSSL